MKHLFLSLYLLLSILFNPFNVKKVNEFNISSNIEFDCSSIEFAFDSSCYKESTFEGKIKITRLKESKENFNINISIINEGFIYSYLDDPTLSYSQYISFLNYYFDFKIDKSYLINNFKIRIDYSYLDSYKTIFIPFSSDYLNIVDEEKVDIYYKAKLANNTLYIYKNTIDLTYISLFKDQIYYDFLKFKFLKIKTQDDTLVLNSVVLGLEDNSSVFKDVSTYLFSYALFPLNFKKEENEYFCFNENLFYLDETSFLLKKNSSEKNNILTKNIYFPSNKYDEFKESSSFLILTFNNYLTIKYNFLLTVENNLRSKEFFILQSNEALL